MKNKFTEVEVESDTKILLSQETKIAKYDALFQYWSWDGYRGMSLIFCAADLVEINLDELKNLVAESDFCIDSEDMTIKESGAYVFVNFNFESES
jgi:hypothetical protein